MGASAQETRRGGLDLLRAVAVVAVLLYHADHVLPGGLLGVTVFFTLSGYLIGGQLWREFRSSSRIDLGAFWSRRVRRLVPASAATVAAIVILWPALGYDLPAADVLSSLLPLRNWEMLHGSVGYGASPSPTAHFWSLAVEEQIYLVLPFVVWGLARLGRPRLALGVVGGGAVASFAWAISLAASGRLDRAYLGTDARVGEVLLGVGVAIWTSERARPVLGPRIGSLLTGGAFAVIAGLSVGVEWPSRAVSTWAIPSAALAAALVCVASETSVGWAARAGRSPAGRFLADHAYELYLVHVPVYALLTTYRTGWASGPLLLGRLGATIGLAMVLHRFVEPVRHRRWLPSPRLLAATLVGVVVTTGVAGVAAEARGSRAGVRTSAGPVALSETEQAIVAGLAGPADGTTPTVAPAAPSTAVQPTRAEAERAAPASGSPLGDSPTPTVARAPEPTPRSIWLVGDSTLRELDDPHMTARTLSAGLAADGWSVSGVVAFRALATCGVRPLDDPFDDLPAIELPALRDALADWFAVAPARHVLIQIGSNDIAQFDLGDDELRACLAATLDALPADVVVWWVLPHEAPWCWCALDDYRTGTAQFEAVLTELATDRPNVRLVHDALFDLEIDLRETLAEDGVHATERGRDLRVEGLLAQIGGAGA